MLLVNEAKTRGLVIGAPLVLVCEVFVVFPLVIYLGNLLETGITLPGLIGVCLLIASISLMLLLGIDRLLPVSLRAAYNGLLSILAI